ncbi:MAG: Hpt domain-containing protein [Paracoccaceae bacterium]
MIDWGRVNNLRDEIGVDDFSEVIELFLEETDDVIIKFPDPSNCDGIGKSLHFLKGSALNLGFSDLAAICQEGERIANTGTTVGIDLGRVAAVYHSSKRAFLIGLQALSAA